MSEFTRFADIRKIWINVNSDKNTKGAFFNYATQLGEVGVGGRASDLLHYVIFFITLNKIYLLCGFTISLKDFVPCFVPLE